MLKKLVIVLILAGLLGEIPVLSAEDCDVKTESKEAARNCALKNEPAQQTKDRIEEQGNKGSSTISAEEMEKMTKETKEGNDILDELIKQ